MAETLTARVEVEGRVFPFPLFGRPLDLGTAGVVSYYWIDSRRFRAAGGGPHFRACVEHWWAAMQSIGADTELATRANLVLAEIYPLVAAARSLQDVYRDAHLHRTADRAVEVVGVRRGGRPQVRWERAYNLPEDEADRLRQLAHTRDPERIRCELERLFLGERPTAEERLMFQEAYRAWIGKGLHALRIGGRDGLRGFVAAEVRPWIARCRRRGGLGRERLFLNLLGYEAKLAFYLCYANAWIGLIPWLVAQGVLDPLGERLLRLWHHQNQPKDDPALAPADRRDVFSGQVLALHPLSGIALVEPHHRQAIGTWIAHPDHAVLQARGRVATCPAYWDLVATILIAAHEYRHARDRWEATRGRVTLGGENAEGLLDRAGRDGASERQLRAHRRRRALARGDGDRDG